MLAGKLIAFAGLIGVGKSYMAEKLAQLLSLKFFTETHVNTSQFMEFLSNIPKNGASFQYFLLNHRFTQAETLSSDEGAVFDRTIYEDRLFAKKFNVDGIMSDYDYNNFIDLANTMYKKMRKPDIIIYLETTPEIALERINQRNRPGEVGAYTLEYLTKLNEGYPQLIEELSNSIQIIRIKYDNFKTPEEFLELIYSAYKKIRIIDL